MKPKAICVGLFTEAIDLAARGYQAIYNLQLGIYKVDARHPYVNCKLLRKLQRFVLPSESAGE